MFWIIGTIAFIAAAAWVGARLEATQTPEQREAAQARRDAKAAAKVRTKTVYGRRDIKRHLRKGWVVATSARSGGLGGQAVVIMTKTGK